MKRAKNRLYFGEFKNWEQVGRNFNGTVYSTSDRTHVALTGSEPKYVFASYGIDGYEGFAMVVFHRQGKWFHTEGAHCSCYGLEDQWKPEEFKPDLYFKGLKEGKKLFTLYWTEAKEEDFARWLKLKSDLVKGRKRRRSTSTTARSASTSGPTSPVEPTK